MRRVFHSSARATAHTRDPAYPGAGVASPIVSTALRWSAVGPDRASSSHSPVRKIGCIHSLMYIDNSNSLLKESRCPKITRAGQRLHQQRLARKSELDQKIEAKHESSNIVKTVSAM